MQPESSSQLLREFMASGTNLLRSDLELAKEELKLAAKRFQQHSVQTAIFGGLLLLSVLPFIAFLVLGLGELLEGRYWLSALLVAIAFAAIGGIFAYRAFRKLKEEDLALPETSRSLQFEKNLVKTKIQEMGAAIKGSNYEYGK